MSKASRGAHLLVLDDDPEVVAYLEEMLAEAGYTVTGATSPLAALERVKRPDLDLVIADVEMPELRGLDFLTAALAANPRLLVILITAFGSIELGVQALRLGASAATDLTVLITGALRERLFRPDLYYRLNVLRLELPPLRERPEDILALVDVLLLRAGERLARSVVGISAGAMRKLLAYPWPGNVRELSNTLERAVALAEHDTLCPEDIRLEGAPPEASDDPVWEAVQRGAPLEQVERAYIRRVLAAHHGNKVHAARVLGIDRRTLRRKLGEAEEPQQDPGPATQP